MPSRVPDTAESDLRDILQQWTYATQEWRDIRREAATDMRYVSGDPWEPKDRRAREDAGRRSNSTRVTFGITSPPFSMATVSPIRTSFRARSS